jgi:hypothetical protein
LCLGVTLAKLTIYTGASRRVNFNKQFWPQKKLKNREEGKFGIPGLCPQPNTRPPVVHAMVNLYVVTPAIFSPAKSSGTWRQSELFRRSSAVEFCPSSPPRLEPTVKMPVSVRRNSRLGEFLSKKKLASVHTKKGPISSFRASPRAAFVLSQKDRRGDAPSCERGVLFSRKERRVCGPHPQEEKSIRRMSHIPFHATENALPTATPDALSIGTDTGVREISAMLLEE